MFQNNEKSVVSQNLLVKNKNVKYGLDTQRQIAAHMGIKKQLLDINSIG